MNENGSCTCNNIIVETIPFNLPVASMVFNPITLATSVIPQPLGMQGPLNCIYCIITNYYYHYYHYYGMNPQVQPQSKSKLSRWADKQR